MNRFNIDTFRTVVLAIVAFAAVQVYNDHATLSAVVQWQSIYGQKIDNISSFIQKYNTYKTISISTTTNE